MKNKLRLGEEKFFETSFTKIFFLINYEQKDMMSL